MTIQQHNRMHGDFDGCLLIRDIYVRLAAVSPHPREVFRSLSVLCTPERLQQFEQKVAATKEKAQRSVFRDFFLELELTEEMKRKNLQNVPTLPEKFVVLGDVMSRCKSQNEENRGEGLAALFGNSLDHDGAV
jgi:hypothetical protein